MSGCLSSLSPIKVRTSMIKFNARISFQLFNFTFNLSLSLLFFSPNWSNCRGNSHSLNFILKVFILIHFCSRYVVIDACFIIIYLELQYAISWCVKFEFIIEIQYLTLQYWATSASACSVVLFLAFARRRRAPSSPSHWGVRFSLCSIFFQALVSVAALATTSQIGMCFLGGFLNCEISIPVILLLYRFIVLL